MEIEWLEFSLTHFYIEIASFVAAQVVEEQGARTPGKRSLAMAAFARALRSIPTTICDNAGALEKCSCARILETRPMFCLPVLVVLLAGRMIRVC